MTRNQELQKLQKKGWSYKELGDKYKITRTRAWQICNKKKRIIFYCKKHRQKYTKECQFCRIDSYYKQVLRENGNILREIKLLKVKDRSAEFVHKRKILVTKLKDDFNFSFRRIGELLERHYSSIIYLYDSFKKE